MYFFGGGHLESAILDFRALLYIFKGKQCILISYKGAFLYENLKEWILKSENEVSISFLNKLIQDLSDHGASKKPKNSL